jgi:hypothetical protein
MPTGLYFVLKYFFFTLEQHCLFGPFNYVITEFNCIFLLYQCSLCAGKKMFSHMVPDTTSTLVDFHFSNGIDPWLVVVSIHCVCE